MPIKRCKIGRTKGYKWGDKGKCYRSKAKALKQGRAIKASQNRRKP
jgi:hypothetical protein